MLAEPAGIDLAQGADHTLSFWLTALAPATQSGGRTDRSPNGEVATYYPWGIEQSVKPEPNSEYWIVRYVLPLSDVDYLLAYCADHIYDSIHELVTGRDYGAKVSDLVAKHWPVTMGLLKNGSAPWDVLTPGLIQVVGSDTQWVVAAAFTDESDSDTLNIPASAWEQLLRLAVESFNEVKDGLSTLPGIIDILGGPNYATRRLRDAGSVINIATNVLKMFSG